ncbi:hypothetical protein [Burkholderia ubonensis]|uniref:hypothetical protein n=1 Tax=Burkholderia ubonensis TaxID=101571 RepID=UPI000A556187|nr:hypothetical protein [Burkholderia ubonensis]
MPLDARRAVGIEVRETRLRGAEALLEQRMIRFAEQRAGRSGAGPRSSAFGAGRSAGRGASAGGVSNASRPGVRAGAPSKSSGFGSSGWRVIGASRPARRWSVRRAAASQTTPP